MNKVTLLHAEAMRLAEEAALLCQSSKQSEARSLFAQAFQKEKEAAASTPDDIQPTRSVLLRSAAALAIDAGELAEAERLIGLGLAGTAPEPIRQELRDLFEVVTFNRHFEVRGTTLAAGEIQLSLAGDAVGPGIIQADEWTSRVSTVDTLLLRTAERKRSLPFRDRGRPPRHIRESVTTFLSIPRAASFAVTIRIGGAEKQKDLFVDDHDVVHDVLECIRLFNDGDAQSLSDQIGNRDYFLNFCANARNLGPDGERIRSVGLTATVDGKHKMIALAKPKSMQWRPKHTKAESVVITGVLTEAANKSHVNTIGIRGDDGDVTTVAVPKALMADIVRPLWDRKVSVVARKRGTYISLRQISPTDQE